ncbi:MAG: hypothetical protein DIKNOCCD_01031 [bacterium]|nr:hypothetical protein [bacterium]MCE7908322.1 zinc ribbon domain-containing protein [Candidatus Omnitrophica bacterium COP1]
MEKDMPLIEYTCLDCLKTYEILSGVSQEGDLPVCPSCGSSRSEKALSVFAAKAAAGARPSPAPAAPTGGCGHACGCHRH